MKHAGLIAVVPGLALFLTVCSIVPSASAATVDLGDVIVNGTFDTNLNSWTEDEEANQRADGDAIDIGTGNLGFNNSFSSGFAVLGDISGDITSDPVGGTSAISQSVSLPHLQGGNLVSSYDVTISFNSAFDGDGNSGTDDFVGSFNGDTINGITSDTELFSQSLANNCALSSGCVGTQLDQSFSDTISVSAGAYNISFLLDEAGGSNSNTAAGIDNVSVEVVANTIPTVDLTTDGATGTANGAIFKQTDPFVTGTGNISSFVQIGGNDAVVEAYNTTVNGTLDNGGSDEFNHELLLSDIPIVALDTDGDTVEDALFREFLLDINQNNNGEFDHLLSLDELQVYVNILAGNSSTTDPSTLGDLVYDLDGITDTSILLDYGLNTGSGSGDMFAYIPNSLFTGYADDDFVYLYSLFGTYLINNDGFEEWAVRKEFVNDTCETIGNCPPPPPPPVIPEPSSILLLGTGLGALGLGARRRARKA